jgi:hydrogenase maturation protease
VGQERITVMGVGNPLIKDEGVGVRVVEELMARYHFPENVTVIDAGTMGLSILNLFKECDYLLVVDAADGTGRPPGTIVRLAAEDIAANQILHSLHDVRFIDVLQAAELSGHRPESDFIGVQIEDMDGVSIGLTPSVDAAVPAAAAVVLEVLAERGVQVTVRDADDGDARADLLEDIRLGQQRPPGGAY